MAKIIFHCDGQNDSIFCMKNRNTEVEVFYMADREKERKRMRERKNGGRELAIKIVRERETVKG
jgi:hypothetical protein